MAQSFPEKLIEDLGYYVYMYSDPKTKKPFYVGKGTGNRAFSHLNFDVDDTEDSSEKLKKIDEKFAAYNESVERVNQRNKQVKGQISIFDYDMEQEITHNDQPITITGATQ